MPGVLTDREGAGGFDKLKYALIPRPRYKKHTSKAKRQVLRSRLESQWRYWCGPGDSKCAEYVAWMNSKEGLSVVMEIYGT